MAEKSTFDLEDFLKPIPLPTAKDKFFTSEGHPFANACLNFTRHDWALYATGYKDAADLLVSQVLSKGRHHDTMVYPIVFLYRQYLELALKNLIRLGRRLQGETSKPEPDHHRLESLWQECHRLLQEAEPDGSSNELKQVGRLLREFAVIDPQSTAFRYPTDRDGNPSLPGLTHINLDNISRVVDKVSTILGGAECMLDEYLGYKADMEAEMEGGWY